MKEIKISDQELFICETIYKMMVRNNIDMLAFQSRSIDFAEDMLYNNNLDIYYKINKKEIACLKSLRDIRFETFNHYYHMEESKKEEIEKQEKEERRKKKQEDFFKSYEDFYGDN